MLSLLKNQQGDTIIEVLITIAIISLVLVGAYVATNKNTQSLQNTQERTTAQKLVNGQVESLYTNRTNPIGGSFTCYGQSGAPASGNGCIVSNLAGSGATYTIEITAANGSQSAAAHGAGCGVPSTASSTYVVCAYWTSLGGNANNDNNLTMYYRVN